ncbi:MAG: DUF2953 domain-containing protein [bacterium]
MSKEVVKVLFYFLLISLLLCLIILFTPVEFRIIYSKHKQKNSFSLDVNIFYKIHGIKIEIPYIQSKLTPFFLKIHAEISTILSRILPAKKEKELDKEFNIENININYIKNVLDFFLNKQRRKLIYSSLNLHCNILNLRINYGFNDPAYTGFNYGMIWALISYIIKEIDENICQINTSEINIIPDFENSKLNIFFKGIFTLYFGNIILTVIRLLINDWKGVIKIWKTTRLKN